MEKFTIPSGFTVAQCHSAKQAGPAGQAQATTFGRPRLPERDQSMRGTRSLCVNVAGHAPWCVYRWREADTNRWESIHGLRPMCRYTR
jgi:hypothetical protein